MRSAAEFEDQRYLVVRQAVAPQVCDLVRTYVRSEIARGSFAFDEDRTRRWARYKDPLSEALLRTLQPELEERSGRRLAPTYSFTALYPPGAYLAAHSDRHSCEISASLTIDMREREEPCEPWGLWFELPDGPRELLLEPGDLVLYRGIELRHWREELPPRRWNSSVFLHYVDADGPYADLAGDAGAGAGPG